MYKMEKLNIPTRFIRYVRHFLSGRKTRVDVNGSKSDPFRLDEGLPQGSSISPLLFLIFINDIDVDLDADTTASLFADDTATWMKDGRIKGSNRVLMQQEINKIMDWATTWKMKVNEDKTRAMVFSTSSNDLKWDQKFGSWLTSCENCQGEQVPGNHSGQQPQISDTYQQRIHQMQEAHQYHPVPVQQGLGKLPGNAAHTLHPVHSSSDGICIEQLDTVDLQDQPTGTSKTSKPSSTLNHRTLQRLPS